MRKRPAHVYQFMFPPGTDLPEELELYRRLQMSGSRGDEQAIWSQMSARYPMLARRGRTLESYVEKLRACFLPKTRWERIAAAVRRISDVREGWYRLRRMAEGRLAAWR